MIISILNQKGGVGKTTLALNLARYFTKKQESTLLIDSDIQGSVMLWHAKKGNNEELIHVRCHPRPSLNKEIERYADKYKWIFIDGMSNVSVMSASAIGCSDLVLIPTQPSNLDTASSFDIVRLIKEFQAITDGIPKAAFIVNRKIINTNLSKGIREELEPFGMHVFKMGTSQRVAYAECIKEGLTIFEMGGDAKESQNEITLIAKELEDYIDDIQ